MYVGKSNASLVYLCHVLLPSACEHLRLMVLAFKMLLSMSVNSATEKKDEEPKKMRERKIARKPRAQTMCIQCKCIY